MKRSLLLLTSMLITAVPVLTAQNPWVGTWKLDQSKSQLTGETITYSKTGDGKMHFSDGSTVDYDFAVDGKPYPTVDGRTTAWTAAGDHAWDSVAVFDGKELSRTHRVLSGDGKSLTATSTGTTPDGTSFVDKTVYTRVSGGKDLTGTWRSTKVSTSAPNTYVVNAKEGGVVQWTLPAMKATLEGPHDGSELPITGPTIAPGMTMAITEEGPTKVNYTVKAQGKPVERATQTLAADGKSFTEVSWDPGKESEKTTSIYVKQ